MFTAKDVLPLALKNLGVKRQVDIHSIILHWQDIVGADIAQQSRPTNVKNGVLFCAVKTPVWGHHLSMLKDQLLAKIHSHLGQKLLDDIKFYAGNFQDYTNVIEDEPNFPSRLRSATVNSDQCMEIKAIVHAVSDNHLRYRLQRLLIKDKKRKNLLAQDGWRRCLTCSALCSPDEKYCKTCNAEHARRRREEIRKLLSDVPWLDYKEFNSCHPCSQNEYTRAKQECIQSFLYKIDPIKPNSIELSTLAMLLYQILPEKIDQEIIEKTLRFIGRNRYVLTPRR